VRIELSPDWNEFLSLLTSKNVRFLLVGGHAVAGHGEPRLTEDLDVLVEPTRANTTRLRSALVDFGFGEEAPSVDRLAVPGKIWMLGRKPWRIDILTKIDGVSFARAWKGRVRAAFAHGHLFVIGRKELIANKRASGREKDLRDVAMLEALSPTAMPRRPRR
jgi:hypothetical protein